MIRQAVESRLREYPIDTKTELLKAKAITKKALKLTGSERTALLQQAADIKDAVDRAIARGEAKPLTTEEAYGMMAGEAIAQ